MDVITCPKCNGSTLVKSGIIKDSAIYASHAPIISQ